jgi:catechol 2,3-dioxygenase-like lactoylglutathione lyase family enzyme
VDCFVDAAVIFYTEELGFKVDMHPNQFFAMLSLDTLRIILSKPNSLPGGGQNMLDGTQQSPGGWNRFAIEVNDLSEMVGRLKTKGIHFRNNIVTGVGVKQIIIEDPSGNPIELFEPIIPEANLSKQAGDKIF